MADLGNITALKAAISAILNNSVPDESIEPDDHNGLLVDLLDTVTGLDKILRHNNQTGGYDLVITAGDLIKLADSGFVGDIDTATLTNNQTYTFQDASGTIAFLSDIGAGITNLAVANVTATNLDVTSDTGTNATLPSFNSTEAGLAPASGGGTTNFLRADGTWASVGGADGNGIYDGNGSLSAPTTVTMGANSLLFSGNETTFKGVDDALGVYSLRGENSSGGAFWEFSNHGHILHQTNTATGSNYVMKNTAATGYNLINFRDSAGSTALISAYNSSYSIPFLRDKLEITSIGGMSFREAVGGNYYFGFGTGSESEAHVKFTTVGSFFGDDIGALTPTAMLQSRGRGNTAGTKSFMAENLATTVSMQFLDDGQFEVNGLATEMKFVGDGLLIATDATPTTPSARLQVKGKTINRNEYVLKLQDSNQLDRFVFHNNGTFEFTSDDPFNDHTYSLGNKNTGRYSQLTFDNDLGVLGDILWTGSTDVVGGNPLLVNSVTWRGHATANRMNIMDGTGGGIYIQTAWGATDANTDGKWTSAGLLIGNGIGASAATHFLNVRNTFLVEDSTNNKLIETSNSNALGFYGALPVVQPTTGIATSVFVQNTSGADNTATFDGYTIGQVVNALRQVGILA
jgi:hypothetical protein